MIKITLILLSFFILNVAEAKLYFCPTTNKYINTGDSMQKVEQQCGKPTQTSTRRQTGGETAEIEQWFYQFPTASQLGRAKPQTTFSLKDDKILQINMAGQTVSSTSVCRLNEAVALGDTKKKLRRVCGLPTFINKSQAQISSETKLITVWTYNYGPYRPSTTLEFEKGVLVDIKTGSP